MPLEGGTNPEFHGFDLLGGKSLDAPRRAGQFDQHPHGHFTIRGMDLDGGIDAAQGEQLQIVLAMGGDVSIEHAECDGYYGAFDLVVIH